MIRILKKIGVVTIIGITLYLGLILLSCCWDWFVMNKLGVVHFSGLAGLPSMGLRLLLFYSSLFLALLTVMLMLVKKTRGISLYFVSVCVAVFSASIHPYFSRYDFCIRVTMHGNIVEELSFKREPMYDKESETIKNLVQKTTLYIPFGKNKLEAEGYVKEYRDYEDVRIFYLVDFFSTDIGVAARVYDKNLSCIKTFKSSNYAQLEAHVEQVFNCFLVE